MSTIAEEQIDRLMLLVQKSLNTSSETEVDLSAIEARLAALEADSSSYSITWTNISTYANGWENFGSAQITAAYAKDSNGWVWLRGTIKNGSWSAKAFGLPTGHRPSATHTFTASCYNRVVANVVVQSDGDVNVYSATGSNDYLHLNGIGFYVGV